MSTKTVVKTQQGFSLVEIMVAIIILSMISIATLGLLTALINSATLAKRKAVASTLANNQIEYLKSLPYNSLAVAGGSIVSSNPLPNSFTQVLSGVTYTVKTSINYVDDAYDGCGSYPDLATKQLYCRNYPAPSGAPATDLNPADYKILHVSVYAPIATKLAEVDTEISARVAETASTTGALFVKVIDQNGSPVSGATVQVTDITTAPPVSVSDSSDSNGEAIFFGLPPDTNAFDYQITASLAGYSTLSTIIPSGSLQPNYPNQKIFTQLSSNVTLVIKPQGSDSLLIEATNTAGAVLPGVKVYVKGGYKKYTATTDTLYYFDNLTGSDTRPTTDAAGLAKISNLVPGAYIFCGDAGATSCVNGGTTYYVAAAVPYGGTNAFNPINVPIYLAASPPSITYPYGGLNYLQKVRLILTTSSTFPRINTMTPDDASLGVGGLTAFAFTINGRNLPCSAIAASCSTAVKMKQGASVYTASCTGAAAGTDLNCTINISAAVVGAMQLEITVSGNTLTIPSSLTLGGINVTN
jgi:prepilin-type N-terminal cleavage/methylation domain-containing protein